MRYRRAAYIKCAPDIRHYIAGRNRRRIGVPKMLAYVSNAPLRLNISMYAGREEMNAAKSSSTEEEEIKETEKHAEKDEIDDDNRKNTRNASSH